MVERRGEITSRGGVVRIRGRRGRRRSAVRWPLRAIHTARVARHPGSPPSVPIDFALLVERLVAEERMPLRCAKTPQRTLATDVPAAGATVLGIRGGRRPFAGAAAGTTGPATRRVPRHTISFVSPCACASTRAFARGHGAMKRAESGTGKAGASHQYEKLQATSLHGSFP
jgi:hypothetical protein